MALSVQPPEGFAQHFKQSGFTDPWEPLLSRKLDDQVQIGVVLREAHCNSRGFAHGGFLASLADNAMGLSIGTALQASGRTPGSLVTTNLSVDYIGIAQVGEWIATNTTVLKAGNNLCVASCTVGTDAGVVARANATFLNRSLNRSV